jgi:hypothetical protein|tara:strand:+ start:131 stop:400 length:270 start_codon:yes stop_codon:yes gene_type:complete
MVQRNNKIEEKMRQMKLPLYDMLLSQAEAEKNKAFLTLDLLSNHPAGIGDHSTSDFYNNANEALEALASADDKIEALKRYFNIHSEEIR